MTFSEQTQGPACNDRPANVQLEQWLFGQRKRTRHTMTTVQAPRVWLITQSSAMSTPKTNTSSHKAVSFWSAVSLGIGAMVGAGIFALLGQAGAMAGSAVYLSFLIGGGIALLSGYSMAKLGARYPSAGGIVEYLVQCFGVGFFSGWMSVVLYVAALVALSMIARAFGSYAAALLTHGDSALLVSVISVSVTFLLVILNLRGAEAMAKLERWVVAVKMAILGVLTIAGAFYIHPQLLSPKTYPATSNILFSVALTFFAYEGFRVITNAAEDMPNPSKTLPRAMAVAITIVIFVYVAVAVTVFGNLPASDVVAAKDYALAEAARPAFGAVGFTIVGIGALISTASAINANLYAITNVTYQMAKNGELPELFEKQIVHSREGLVVSGSVVMVLSALLDVGDIASIGSLLILIVHCAVHVGHLRLTGKTGASRLIVALAALVTGAAVVAAGYHAVTNNPKLIIVSLAFIGATVVAELILRSSRTIRPRIVGEVEQ